VTSDKQLERSSFSSCGAQPMKFNSGHQETLFLHISDEVRAVRLETRGGVKTDEEVKITSKSNLFRERLKECYRRMKNPSVSQVDASGTPEQVFQLVKTFIPS